MLLAVPVRFKKIVQPKLGTLYLDGLVKPMNVQGAASLPVHVQAALIFRLKLRQLIRKLIFWFSIMI